MKKNADSEIPHITKALMSNAVPFLKRKSRGRPRGSTKSMVSLRIDSDVYSWLKKSGPGYQGRINAILRQMYEINHASREESSV